MRANEEIVRERAGAPAFEVERVRRDFPILQRPVNGRPLVYLDTAASAQKPRAVLDEMTRFMSEDYANIHRGVYALSQRSTALYDAARQTVARFIHAGDAREIVFVRNATEGINLVASSYGRHFLEKGDEVLITHMEHHANIVPWQLLRQEKGIALRVAPITDAGELDMDAFERMLTDRVKFVSVVHVSNSLGTVNPVQEIVRLAHARGIPVLIDGSQAALHMPVDVRDLDADFYVFSGHKVYGPTGIGVVFAKLAHLEAMPPYQGGGLMISFVTFENTEFSPPPQKFEAGTPNIAGAIGLGAAIDYVSSLGLADIHAHESALLAYGTELLREIPGLRLIGTAREKSSILAFVIDGVDPQEIGAALGRNGIAVRAGHHCTQPLMGRLGLPSTTRASIGLYTTREDIDALATCLREMR
ncbi:SufS family cysteine desulfurase [Polyangium sorediatum]|uniref:Probable cysteine desulfurase n=1 Tax=Polyangium sorediatum TaxID=889274 RepID=A0ABT6P6L0_9BACT|nr:cysteine desulfurase [Polyangium sorediatum]MDI1436245.1 cysteine desulfurase [Polyangium sorediatum]